jgi:hypothetical protein
MQNIPGWKGNENQSDIEISPYTNQNGYHQKHKQQQMFFSEFGNKGTLLHCWWECKLVQQLWKPLWSFLGN